MRKRQPPAPPGEHEKTDWTYWVSRDSLDGALSATCSLWNVKPLRTRVGTRVVWMSAAGFISAYHPDEVTRWFRTYPETDRELLVVQTRPSKSELEDAKRTQGIK